MLQTPSSKAHYNISFIPRCSPPASSSLKHSFFITHTHTKQKPAVNIQARITRFKKIPHEKKGLKYVRVYRLLGGERPKGVYCWCVGGGSVSSMWKGRVTHSAYISCVEEAPVGTVGISLGCLDRKYSSQASVSGCIVEFSQKGREREGYLMYVELSQCWGVQFDAFLLRVGWGEEGSLDKDRTKGRKELDSKCM